MIMAQPTTVPQIQTPTQDEQILVIRRGHLFPDGAWYGLEDVDMHEYLHIIRTYQEFQPRSAMENDPRYKQIIPYLVFRHNGRYFLMERKQMHLSNGSQVSLLLASVAIFEKKTRDCRWTKFRNF